MLKTLGNLIIRAEASTEIGIGHVMRCFALAQAWQDSGGCSSFVMAEGSALLEARLKSEEMEVMYLSDQPGSMDDASRTADLAHERNASWVVVDGYAFGAVYQQVIKDSGKRLLFVDDYGRAEHYCADIVLNQNIHAEEDLYTNRESYTKLLLGARYVLLRREFLKWQGWQREIPEVARKILVTLGGSDPDNVTLKVIQALAETQVEGLQVTIVVGDSNSHYRDLESAVRETNPKVSLHLARNATNIADLMAWADVAVITAGGTLWELLFMGCPVMSFVKSAVQETIVRALGCMLTVAYQGYEVMMEKREFVSALHSLTWSKERREQMSKQGKVLIDGEGVKRTLRALEQRDTQPILEETRG
jgi:UDP-2,4-diacetamido-2,4,6-trideoxy-beta-L-altropyranose hydrolase